MAIIQESLQKEDAGRVISILHQHRLCVFIAPMCDSPHTPCTCILSADDPREKNSACAAGQSTEPKEYGADHCLHCTPMISLQRLLAGSVASPGLYLMFCSSISKWSHFARGLLYLLLWTLSKRYIAAAFISWTSLGTTATRVNPEKCTYNQSQITLHHDAEHSQPPEMAKTPIICRCCSESLKSTEGLKIALHKTGLNWHVDVGPCKKKESSPKRTAPAAASLVLLFRFSH